MRSFKHRLVATVSGGLILSAALVIPAAAEPALDLDDPSSVLNTIAPQEHTSPSEAVDIVSDTDARRSSGPDSSAQSVEVVDTVGEFTTVNMQLPGASYSHTVDEFTVLDTDGDAGRYIKALPNGAQVIFVADDADDTDSFRVDFETGITDHASVDGAELLTLGSGVEVAVFAPWAYDANGVQLETELVIDNKGITQAVDTSSAQFPVIADPAWSYTRSYDVGGTTPSEAESILRGCFNCNFPVTGAPRIFPRSGQLLPLTVGQIDVPGGGSVAMSFECRFDTTFSDNEQGGPTWGFRFNATRNHVDGSGSSVSFTFRDQTGGSNVLSVFGDLAREPMIGDFTIPRAAYLVGAGATWSEFADNMTT